MSVWHWAQDMPVCRVKAGVACDAGVMRTETAMDSEAASHNERTEGRALMGKSTG